MSAPTPLEAAFSLEWQAKYIRRATAVADALAHFAAGEGCTDRAGDADIVAGGVLFLSSYLGRIAEEAESSSASLKGAAQ
ncbi:hypothetical protein [Acetobacter orientalis]|uniref:Uncharacterized protein n=1 Tax=Acetobacter orientalis TaxID=146474 RepID=A0A252A2L4_9PROT|nr:hypothetical protein [Acetobacter orientalis]OUI82517.1 hypothetical protein HK12_03975 [Acetobacter orientalis]